jgi:hypothetical protein
MPPVASGDLIENYPYLWLRQDRHGETAGRKERPVCVALAIIGKDGLTHLALLPISSQPPTPDQAALELPAQEAKRAGFTMEKRVWLYVSEYNYDILERSFSIAPVKGKRRRLSAKFMRRVLNAFRPVLEKGGARVDRR